MATAQVQWDDTAVWSDLDLETARGRHGSSRSNPDRPAVLSAAGSMVVDGERGRPEQRFPLRLVLGSTTIFSGLITDPQLIPWPARTQWTIIGLRAVDRFRRVEFTRPAATVAQTLADSAFWAALGVAAPAAVHLPARSLGSFNFRSSLGDWLSKFALAASAQIVERADGSLRLANPHIAAAPAGIETISSQTSRILRIDTVDRTDRIRNSAKVRIPATSSSHTTDHSQTITPSVSPSTRVTALIRVPDDGAAYAGWAVSATARIRVATGLVRATDSSGRQRANYYWRPTLGWVSAAATATLGTPNSDGDIPVTVDIARTRYRWQQWTGTDRVSRTWDGGRLVFTYTSGAARGYPDYPANADGALAMEVTITATAQRTAATSTPEVVYVASNADSIAKWGELPLALPEWVITDAGTAAAAVQAQIDGLAELRREHTVTFPISRQPTGAEALRLARIDAGDYVHLAANDADRDISINSICLVTERAFSISPDAHLPQISLRCLETPAPAPAAPPGTPRQLSVRAASATAIDADWAAPATGGPVVSYTLRWRARPGGAWRSRTGYSGRSGRISSLAPATAYEVQVRANGADASSAWTPPQTATTLDAPPRPVTGLTVGIDSGELDLSWTAPSGGGTVLGYDVEWTSTGQWSGRGSGSASTRGTSHTISGLVDGTPYAVRVRAHGPGGESAWVEGSGTPRAPVAPGAVQGVSAVPADGQIAVGWNQPATGDPATGYRVEWRTGSGAWSGADKAATARTHTIGGLANGTAYTVRVRAANAAGAGPWTSATATPAEVTLPPAPAISISRQIGSFHRFTAAPGSWGGGRATNRSRWQRWLVIGNVGRWVAYGRDPESTLNSGSFTNASRVRVQCEWQPTGTSGLSARIWSPWTEWTASGQSGEDTDPRTPLTVDGAPLAVGGGLLHTDEART